MESYKEDHIVIKNEDYFFVYLNIVQFFYPNYFIYSYTVGEMWKNRQKLSSVSNLQFLSSSFSFFPTYECPMSSFCALKAQLGLIS